jgi:hypothetical protein
MSNTADLSVRQHERHGCSVPARVTIAPACAEAVKLLKVGASGITARVVDFSGGGLGLSSPVYVPLTSQLRVAVADDTGQTLRVDLRVQRIVMLDKGPTYYVGTAFESPSPEQRGEIERMLSFLGSSSVGGQPRA